jgi:hypothetical protein
MEEDLTFKNLHQQDANAKAYSYESHSISQHDPSPPFTSRKVELQSLAGL